MNNFDCSRYFASHLSSRLNAASNTKYRVAGVRYTLVCRQGAVLSMLSLGRLVDKLKCIEQEEVGEVRTRNDVI